MTTASHAVGNITFVLSFFQDRPYVFDSTMTIDGIPIVGQAPVLRLLCRLGGTGGPQCRLRVPHPTGAGWTVRVPARRRNLEWNDWRTDSDT